MLPADLRVAGLVSFYGPRDLVEQVNEKGLSKGIQAVTGVQEMNAYGAKQLAAVSPYDMVKKGLPPFLLLHGTTDELAPTASRFVSAMR